MCFILLAIERVKSHISVRRNRKFGQLQMILFPAKNLIKARLVWEWCAESTRTLLSNNELIDVKFNQNDFANRLHFFQFLLSSITARNSNAMFVNKHNRLEINWRTVNHRHPAIKSKCWCAWNEIIALLWRFLCEKLPVSSLWKIKRQLYDNGNNIRNF